MTTEQREALRAAADARYRAGRFVSSEDFQAKYPGAPAAPTMTDLERDVLTQMWRAQASGYGSQPHTPETEALFASFVERGWVAIERVPSDGAEEDFWFVTWAGLRAAGLEYQAVPSA